MFYTLVLTSVHNHTHNHTHLASQNLLRSPGRSWFLLLLNHTSTLLSGQLVFLHRDLKSVWDTRARMQLLDSFHPWMHTLQRYTSTVSFILLCKNNISFTVHLSSATNSKIKNLCWHKTTVKKCSGSLYLKRPLILLISHIFVFQ